MGNSYIVSYSKLQKKFMLIEADSKHIIKVSDLFQGIYEKIKMLKKDCCVHLVFTDSAIDELQIRGLEKDYISYI